MSGVSRTFSEEPYVDYATGALVRMNEYDSYIGVGLSRERSNSDEIEITGLAFISVIIRLPVDSCVIVRQMGDAVGSIVVA